MPYTGAISRPPGQGSIGRGAQGGQLGVVTTRAQTGARTSRAQHCSTGGVIKFSSPGMGGQQIKVRLQ